MQRAVSFTTPLLKDDRFAAQSRVGCVIAIGDHFVLCCDAILRCRIVKIWKHVDVSSGVFESEASPDSNQKRSDHSLGMEDFVSLFCAFKKVNPFLPRVALKKLVGEFETHGPCTKATSSSILFLEVLQRRLGMDLPVLFFSGSAMQSLKDFQRR